MRALSIKAFIIANIVNLVLITAFAVCIGLGAGIVSAAMSSAWRPDQSDAVMAVLTTLSVAVPAYVAGHLAARIAGRGELWNGALSSTVVVLFNVADGVFGPFFGPEKILMSPLADFMFANCGPLFGLLGGYVAMRRGRRVGA